MGEKRGEGREREERGDEGGGRKGRALPPKPLEMTPLGLGQSPQREANLMHFSLKI